MPEGLGVHIVMHDYADCSTLAMLAAIWLCTSTDVHKLVFVALVAALQTRVGIATGLVVVGDLIGSGASQEQAIVGEAPNLAARLQGVAEP